MPASRMKQAVVSTFLEHGILQQQIQGRQKVFYYLPEEKALHAFLKNQFGINDLPQYVEHYGRADLSRAEAIAISSDSKLKAIRTFKGFLVNCYQPVAGTLKDEPISILPREGTFTFIYDFEDFLIDPEVRVVGIENPENFRYISKQKYLFPNITPLFVSRYPQTKDLIRWLQMIPNPYLHFGDFDPASISIYLSEYQQHLGDRASFFIPQKLEKYFQHFGKRALYEDQLHLLPPRAAVKEENLLGLIKLMHQYKKGLEQEIFHKVNMAMNID